MTSLPVVGLATFCAGLWACGSAAPPPQEPIAIITPASQEPVVARPMEAEAPVLVDPQPGGPETWLQKWGKNICPSAFDYFPNGGLQNTWCHRPSQLGLETLKSLSGVPVFVSGPHGEQALRLDANDSFGHYNPAFVQYLIEHGVSERGSVLQRATQGSYDHDVKPLGNVLRKTLAKIRAEPACFEHEKTAYAAAIKKKKAGYYERWFYFMNPAFCGQTKHPEAWYMDHGFDGGVDGNVTKSVVGFWLRRSMDGTFDAFSQGLDKLLAAYDPQ